MNKDLGPLDLWLSGFLNLDPDPDPYYYQVRYGTEFKEILEKA